MLRAEMPVEPGVAGVSNVGNTAHHVRTMDVARRRLIRAIVTGSIDGIIVKL